MNEPQLHDAATELAAERTAHSLAREVLGLRAEIEECRRGMARQLEALGELGQLAPTDYQGRDDYHQAVVRILLDLRNDKEAS